MKLLHNENLPFQPNACFVTGRDDGEIVDFERDLVCPDPHLYLKREIVEEAAELLGMVPRTQVEALREQLDAQGAELDQLREDLKLMQDLEELISKKERLVAA